jgi:hypothetical protein
MSAPYASSDLADLLPRRGIAVCPPRTVEGGTLGVIGLLFVMLIGLLAWLGPGIAGDWRMRSDAIPAADVRVSDAQCRSWFGLLRFCSVTLAPDATVGAGGARTLWYAFFAGSGEQTMAPQRSPTDASWLSTDLGLARLHSRLMALLLFTGLFLCCIGVAAAVLWRGVKARRAFAGMSGQRLTPVVVEIERNNRLPPRRRLWVYLYDDGGRRERALAEWPSRQQPLFTTPDERWALALRGEEPGPPMLLDTGLENLDLTDEERAVFCEAFVARFGDRARGAASV